MRVLFASRPPPGHGFEVRAFYPASSATEHAAAQAAYSDGAADGRTYRVGEYFPHGYTKSEMDLIAMPPANRLDIRHGFQGHRREPGTLMWNFGARYLHTGLGRFLTTDPVLDVDPGNPHTWNKYGFVRGNPIRYVDPKGTSVKGAIEAVADLSRYFRGEENAVHVEDAMTRDLSTGPTMDDIRRQYRAAGCKSGTYCGAFNYAEFSSTTTVAGHSIGGFCAQLTNLGSDRVLVRAENTWGRESGTRLPSVPGLPDNRRNCSVQQMASGGVCGLQWPKSVLEDSNSGFMANQRNKYAWIETIKCESR